MLMERGKFSLMEIFSGGFVVKVFLLTVPQLTPVTKDLGFICPLWEPVFKVA